MEINKKTASLISLSMKAGKLVTGEQSCEDALRKKTAHLIIIASDASDNTRQKFINKAFYYNVSVTVYGDRDTLSRLTGKINRTVYAVIDEGFANSIKKYMEDGILEENTKKDM